MGDVTPVDLLPDGRTSLVFRVFEDRAQGDVCVMGPRTRALYKKATGTTRSAMVQLKPGWSASLLGVAASELTDRIVRLEDIWGPAGHDLCRELLATRSAAELLDRVSEALARARGGARRSSNRPRRGSLVRRSACSKGARRGSTASPSAWA